MPALMAFHLAAPLPAAAFPRQRIHRVPTCAVKRKASSTSPTIINRVARHRFDFLETYECGVELLGTEIKSIRQGQMQLRDGYARVKNNELYLYNVHISPYSHTASFFLPDPVRPRRLLLHKRDIRALAKRQGNPGLTLIPSRAYFSSRGFLKVEIALARGKKLHDKREDLRKRDNEREMRRVIKNSMAP